MVQDLAQLLRGLLRLLGVDDLVFGICPHPKPS